MKEVSRTTNEYGVTIATYDDGSSRVIMTPEVEARRMAVTKASKRHAYELAQQAWIAKNTK